MSMDWATWGLPLAVLGGAGVLAAVLATALRPSDAEKSEIGGAGRREDLEERNKAIVQALRDLEVEKDKMAPEDYLREKAALVEKGAASLRELESATSNPEFSPEAEAALAAERARLGDAGFRSAFLKQASKAGVAMPVPRTVGVGQRWQGALGAFAVSGLIAAMYLGAQAYQTPRGESMTGGGPGAAPMQAAPAAPSADVQALLDKVKEDPKDWKSHNRLTAWALDNDRIQDAMEHNAAALEANPKDPEARTYKAVLAATVKLNDRAIALLDEVITDAPDYTLAYVYRGLIEIEAKKYDAAIADLQKARANGFPGEELISRSIERATALRDGKTPPPMPGAAGPSGGPGTPIVSGTITLDPAASGAIDQAKALFVSIKDPAGGPPLAAKKLPVGPFPMTFAVTSADRLPMGGDRPTPAAVDVTVRLDFDGNAMSRADGEPAAMFPGLKTGTAGVAAVLK